MTCDEIRKRLPDAAYDALPADQGATVAAHLRDCADCRRHAEELAHVRGLLRVEPTPPVRVDVAGVYRAAAAASATPVAALAAPGRGGWCGGRGAPSRHVRPPRIPRRGTPVRRALEGTARGTHDTAARCRHRAGAGPSPEEWRVANALLQALVDDARMRDAQYQQDVGRLREQIEDVQRLTARRWASAEKDIRALYLVHFSTAKGANP